VVVGTRVPEFERAEKSTGKGYWHHRPKGNLEEPQDPHSRSPSPQAHPGTKARCMEVLGEGSESRIIKARTPGERVPGTRGS
jgi:hypothetical protein